VPASFLHWTADPTWFYKPGAGPILDLGVYAFHTLTGILSPAKRVTAFHGLEIMLKAMAAARTGVAQELSTTF
jgi:hypothetical protein